MPVHYFDPDPALIPKILWLKYKVPEFEVLGWLERLSKTEAKEFAHGDWVFEIRMGEQGWEVEPLRLTGG